MDILFGYLAGLLTLINPCVLPVLPIVLATSLQADSRAPFALAAGMSISFVLLGLSVSVLGASLGLTNEMISNTAALLMVLFGLFLILPLLSQKFAIATSTMSGVANLGMSATASFGLKGQFLGGVLLGAVWSPCIGPTLGAAIALANQGLELTHSALIMTSFSLGVSTIILSFAFGTKSWLKQNMARMQALAKVSRQILGGAFIIIGLGLWFRVNHVIDAWIINHMPTWLIDFSVTI